MLLVNYAQLDHKMCEISNAGGHINPAVTFGLMLARKVTINRAVFYMVAQVMGAICGAALVKVQNQENFEDFGGGANFVHEGYSTGTGFAAEILGTFLLVYTVFSATDPKRNARDSHVPVSAHNLQSQCQCYCLFAPCGLHHLRRAKLWCEFYTQWTTQSEFYRLREWV